MGAGYDLTRPIHFVPLHQAASALPVLLPADADLPRRAIDAAPAAPRAPPFDI
jgi:hypothetical protein